MKTFNFAFILKSKHVLKCIFWHYFNFSHLADALWQAQFKNNILFKILHFLTICTYRNKLNFILFICTSIFVIHASAQSSPGYLGKKFILEYKYEFNKLSFKNDLFDISIDEDIYRLDNFELGYVLTRGTTLGLRYARMNRTDTLGNNTIIPNNYEIYGINGYFHYFRSRGHIAPLGNFFNLEIVYTNFDLITNNDVLNVNDFGFGFGIGNRFVFANWISFSQEIKYTHFLGYNLFNTERSPEITIKLGLGLLLF